MIKLIASLLGGHTLMAWLIVAGLGLGAVGGLYWYVDRGGYQRATLEWTVKYTERENELQKLRMAEIDRQALANDRAKASERAAIEQLRNETAQLEIQLRERANEAAEDPDRGNIACNLDCVRRHNSIAAPKR